MNVVGAEVGSSPEERLASDRLALIVEASRRLTSQLDTTAATRAILSQAVPVLADYCTFAGIAAEGGVAVTWSTRGGVGAEQAPAGAEQAARLVELTARTKRTQVECSSERARQTALDLPSLSCPPASPGAPTSLVAVPVTSGPDVAGVLTFCFAESRRQHGADDVLVAEELGRRISVAMENARLRGRASAAAGTLLRERERFDVLLRSQEVLVEAGTLLESCVDYAATLRRIVEMTVPRLADYCFIHIPDGDGRLRRVAERYSEANPLERFVAPLKLPPSSPIMRVLRTGASVWLPEVTDADLVSWSQSAEHLTALRGAAPRSLVCVPLISHGRLLGTMVFATSGSGRTYDEDAVSLAEQLGQRAAWALDTALLHDAVEAAKRESTKARKDAEETASLTDILLQILSDGPDA